MLGFRVLGFRVSGFGFRVSGLGLNVNLVLLKPLTLKYARCPGRNNKALEIKYASRGLFFFLGGGGGVRFSLFDPL